MTFSQHDRSDTERELEPRLEAETLKDLTPSNEQAFGVVAGCPEGTNTSAAEPYETTSM